MAKSLSVLFVTSEMFPYARVDSLGDISYFLPLAIRDLGHDIRVMLPKYGAASERKNRIHEINRLKEIPIVIGGVTDYATVKSTSITNPKVKVQAYIATNVNYFDLKKGIYVNPKSGKPFPDNDERFIFFNKAVIETCLRLGWSPDIIHCNGWAASLVPALAKLLFPNKFRKTKIALTIDDFSRQGVFPATTFDKIGFPKEVKPNFIHKGKFNFLKGAISYADHINTVSPTYASEILQDSKHGNDLEQMLIERSDKFSGILTGTDLWVWNPKNDSEIAFNLERDVQQFKSANRKALLNKLGLNDVAGAPVITIFSKLEEHSGTSIFTDTAEKILNEKVIVIFMGDTEPETKTQLKDLQKKYPGKLYTKFNFEEILSHKIIAGSDMLIVPSQYEPSGMNIVFALAYGTIPIARATGAVNDLLCDIGSKEDGNGFIFSGFNHEDLFLTVKRALEMYHRKVEWNELLVKVINKNYTCESSAKKYDEIYRSLVKD